MAERVPRFPFVRAHTFQPPPEITDLRSKCPVTQVQLFDGTRAWAVMRHKDVCEIMQQDSVKLSADRRHPGYPELHREGLRAREVCPTFVNLDEPAHSKQRRTLEAAFSPEAVEKLRPTMQDIIDRNLDLMIEKARKSQPVDLIQDFANQVPAEIIFHMLGVPVDQAAEIARDSELRHSTSRNAAETSNKNLQEKMSELVAQRVDRPNGEDLISRLVREQLQPGHLTRDEVDTLTFLLLTAGNAALINSIGLGIITLLTHPSQWAKFVEDPDNLAPRVVNELLRFNTASALNSRRATKCPIRIGGQDIPKDTGVICAVQSADRDRLDLSEPDPEIFDMDRGRDPNLVLSFGYGIHRCLAESLSRVQLEMVFTTLAQRLPGLRLMKRMEDLPYSPAGQNVGVSEVPIGFGL